MNFEKLERDIKRAVHEQYVTEPLHECEQNLKTGKSTKRQRKQICYWIGSQAAKSTVRNCTECASRVTRYFFGHRSRGMKLEGSALEEVNLVCWP